MKESLDDFPDPIIYFEEEIQKKRDDCVLLR